MAERYVKLSKAQITNEEDITPGELNQSVNVPQLAVHRCHECGQALPERYEPPADEDWAVGICSCFDDPESCRTGFFCPCVLFGKNVERLREEIPWQNACICHAFCVEGGIAAAAATALCGGMIDPQSAVVIFESLFFAWWLCGIYTGVLRQTLQKNYHLRDSPCDPCLVHCCMHWCAICQEHREMQNHLSDEGSSDITVVSPPPVQEMSSGDKQESTPAASSSLDGDHTNLELQPL